MIISNVNIGSGPGANDGESIYSAFYKVNQNFANVQSNVNSLTNSVSSVAGRTGNVTLTINDIVGLNTSYAINGNVTAANIGMKGYVDSKIAANVAALIDSAPGALDTLNELAAALNDDASFATTIVNTINSTNSNLTIANTNMKSYVDGQVSAVNSAITLANTIQSNQITAANLGMKGYVDSVASQSIYGNSNVGSYLTTYTGNIKAGFANITGSVLGLNALTVGLPGIEIFGNTVAQFHSNIDQSLNVAVHNLSPGSQATSGFMASADVGDEDNHHTLMGIVNSGWDITHPFLKPLDSLLLGIGGNLVLGTRSVSGPSIPKDIAFVVGDGSTLEVLRINAQSDLLQANLVLGANVGIKFNDGTRQTSAYSNVQTATFTNLSNYAYNANVTAANLGMKGYVDSVASQSIYGNANVASYLHANDYSPYSNVNVAVFTNLSTYAWNANVTAANLGMKGYVDSVASQSIYGNANVLSYLTQFDGNIIPSANVTYSLGTITNQWKDLFVSNNTIFIGGVPLSVDAGGNLLVNGNTISGGAVTSNSNVSITANSQVWTFGTSGIYSALTLPGEGVIQSLNDTINLTSLNTTSGFANTVYLGSGGGLGFFDGALGGNWIEIFRSGAIPEIKAPTGNLLITTVTPGVSSNTWTFGTNGSITFPDTTVQTTAWTGSTYGNIQVATYLPTYTGNISAGNVFVPGTSGKIGFSSGGFVQQTSSNSTGVTSNTTSGNIQLMSIDLGAHVSHTVAFSCNKLTTDDMLVVKHVSGGVISVIVDAYVVSDGLAIIWLRDITGNGTGAFTAMLKYAIIRAPSS